jgi:hypothetical protein
MKHFVYSLQSNENASGRDSDRQVGLHRGHEGERRRPRQNFGHKPQSHLALTEHAESQFVYALRSFSFFYERFDHCRLTVPKNRYWVNRPK